MAVCEDGSSGVTLADTNCQALGIISLEEIHDTIFLNSYIYGTWLCKSLIHNSKYQRFTNCKDIGNSDIKVLFTKSIQ